MRRKEKQMPKETVYKYLNLCKVVRVGLNDREYPYIVPMNYGYESQDGKDILYMHCATEGRKIDLINEDPKVGFEMDINYGITDDDNPAKCTTKYASIIGTGTMEIVESYTEKVDALSLLMKNVADREIQIFDKRVVDKTTILKLVVKSMTGKINIQ